MRLLCLSQFTPLYVGIAPYYNDTTPPLGGGYYDPVSAAVVQTLVCTAAHEVFVVFSHHCLRCRRSFITHNHPLHHARLSATFACTYTTSSPATGCLQQSSSPPSQSACLRPSRICRHQRHWIRQRHDSISQQRHKHAASWWWCSSRGPARCCQRCRQQQQGGHCHRHCDSTAAKFADRIAVAVCSA